MLRTRRILSNNAIHYCFCSIYNLPYTIVVVVAVVVAVHGGNNHFLFCVGLLTPPLPAVAVNNTVQYRHKGKTTEEKHYKTCLTAV